MPAFLEAEFWNAAIAQRPATAIFGCFGPIDRFQAATPPASIKLPIVMS